MPIILSIETSTSVCSVALHQNDSLLACYELFVEKSHSEQLTIVIENIVKQARIGFKDIDVVAVSKGPGSYTGLRIGVSTAKGLCFALDKPLVFVNTLEAMVLQLKPAFLGQNIYFCPMLDARRMEVYCTILDPNMTIIQPTEAKIIDGNSFEEILVDQKIVFFGDGSTKVKELLAHKENALFVPEVVPSARQIGIIAYQKALNNQFEDIAYSEPYYLKDFVGVPAKKNRIA